VDKRKLRDLEVSSLGLGCMGMSCRYVPSTGEWDEAESVRVIRRAIDLGIDFFDTADAYGPFANERLLGSALRGRREEAVVATKFGVRRRADGTLAGVDGAPGHVRRACEDSLQRLGLDHIDLYYQHRIDPDVPIEETWGALAELVEEGKVRHCGLSEAAPESIRRAHATHPVTAVQSEYSLWSRDVEEEILPLCRRSGIGFVAYSPLGRGFFTGRIANPQDLPEDDYRRSTPRFEEPNFKRNLGLLEGLRDVAADKGVEPGQLALAWLLHQGDDIVPIPGTKRLHYLEENVAAAGVTLTPADLARITPRMAVAGERYGEQEMSQIGR
jgi:aryl-alcohol dehydrogenase-like predicted oxidoreductase